MNKSTLLPLVFTILNFNNSEKTELFLGYENKMFFDMRNQIKNQSPQRQVSNLRIFVRLLH